MALRTVGVRLAAEVSGYINGIRTAQRATKDFAGTLREAAARGDLDAVADQAGRMGLALAGVAGVTIGLAARFDAAMSSVRAATHASAGELELLRQAAIDAGRDTSYSATEAAQAIEELAKAGVATADILGGGLRGALDLAAAAQMDVAEAAEIAASAMTQFRLSGRDVSHVADLLAAGAGKAQGSVHDLGYALSQSGLVAAQMGMSIEETVGTLAAFASAGLMGSDAGTSLKTALLMLANPTDKAAALMEELGIRVYDANGQFVGIVELAGQLQTRLGHLTQEQRNAALATIFGSDAIRSASILYERGARGIQEWINKVNDAGYASETAAAKMDNLAGDLERLRGELETLAITAGSGTNEGLRTLVQAAEALVSQIGSLPPSITSTATVLAGLTGVALLGAAGWIKMRRATAEALEELRATGPVGQRAARGLETTTKWAGRAAAAITGLQIAAAGLRMAAGHSIDAQLDAYAQGLERWARSGELAGEAARILGEDLKYLEYDLQAVASSGWWADTTRWIAGIVEGMTGLGSVMDESLEHARERMSALDAALAQMVQSGNAATAEVVFRRIAEVAKEQGISIDDLKRALPQYAAALEMAASGSHNAAGAIGEVETAAEAAAADVERLRSAFDKLFGAEMDLDRATLAYKQGLVDLKKELTEGARTLDINTKAGRENMQAVLDQIQVIADMRDARIEHGMLIDEANAKYEAELESLRALMIQLGYNEEAVNDLIGRYKAIPKKVETQISPMGVDKAGRVVETYIEWLKRIPREVRTRMVVEQQTVRGGPREFRWGGIVEHARMGLLREAHIAPPTAPARYAYAEPATGGELFAPRYGDFDRTRRIVSYAVENWWGGWHKFVPHFAARQTVPTRGITIENLNIRAYSDRFSLRQVTDELAMYGVR